jgi:hypothetical protein
MNRLATVTESTMRQANPGATSIVHCDHANQLVSSRFTQGSDSNEWLKLKSCRWLERSGPTIQRFLEEQTQG